jgi:hypothetical protein
MEESDRATVAVILFLFAFAFPFSALYSKLTITHCFNASPGASRQSGFQT